MRKSRMLIKVDKVLLVDDIYTTGSNRGLFEAIADQWSKRSIFYHFMTGKVLGGKNMEVRNCKSWKIIYIISLIVCCCVMCLI